MLDVDWLGWVLFFGWSALYFRKMQAPYRGGGVRINVSFNIFNNSNDIIKAKIFAQQGLKEESIEKNIKEVTIINDNNLTNSISSSDPGFFTSKFGSIHEKWKNELGKNFLKNIKIKDYLSWFYQSWFYQTSNNRNDWKRKRL